VHDGYKYAHAHQYELWLGYWWKFNVTYYLPTSLDEIVSHFWKVEDYQTPRQTSTEEERVCEQHYETTVAIGSDNRITVRLPFKESPQALGQSYDTAAKGFFLLERRLNKDASLKESHVQFIRKYITTGHMSLMKSIDKGKAPLLYSPPLCAVAELDHKTTSSV